MCKIASIANVNDENRDKVWMFMRLLGDRMSPGNDDGIGYAAFDKKGNIFGERWLINQTAFTDLSSVKGLNATKMNRIYSFFGEQVLRHEAQAIILHTRAATCGKSIENTHPFVDNVENPTVAIIHNGIIYNHEEFESKFSTCDSEVLAHLYSKHEVHKSIKNVNGFIPDLMGWYTVANLAKDESGKMIVDMYTDNGRLASMYIEELGTTVYASVVEDIRAVAAMLEFKAKDTKHYKKQIGFRLDAQTGDMVDMVKLVEKPVRRSEPIFLSRTGPGIHTAHGNAGEPPIGLIQDWFNKTNAHPRGGTDV